MKTVTLCVHIFQTAALACSCFAVYTPAPVYGMNFDYPPEAEIGFLLSGEDNTVFQMMFFEDSYGQWIPTVGMNSQGIFSSMQYQCPMEEGNADLSENEIFQYQLYGRVLDSCSTFTDVKGVLGDNQVVNLFDLTLHTFIAGTDGRAMIVETGNHGNSITRISEDWLVMTNFPVGDFPGVPLSEIHGVGDDRYRAAMEAINSMYSGFSVDSGLDVLRAARNNDEVWSTKASMVFDPSHRMVYFCIDNDFTKVWQVSMDTGIWETLEGFAEKRSITPGEDMVTVQELREWL